MGDHAMLARLQDGEDIPLEEFMTGRDGHVKSFAHPSTALRLHPGRGLDFNHEYDVGRRSDQLPVLRREYFNSCRPVRRRSVLHRRLPGVLQTYSDSF